MALCLNKKVAIYFMFNKDRKKNSQQVARNFFISDLNFLKKKERKKEEEEFHSQSKSTFFYFFFFQRTSKKEEKNNNWQDN
jgi:hypothetical protein